MHQLDDHYKISFSYMWKDDENSKKGERKPFGCTCQLFHDDILIAWENSICAKEDHFQRALARTISLKRSLKKYELNICGEVVNYIWSIYFNVFPKDKAIFEAWENESN